MNYRGEWYVIGLCEYSQEIRTYAISRIQKANLSTRSYEIPEDFHFNEFIGSHFGIYRSDKNYKVKIEFAPYQAPYIKERIWHESQHIEEHDDGSILLSFPTNHLFEVKRWILSYGPGARVIEPEQLTKMVLDDLEQAVRLYKK